MKVETGVYGVLMAVRVAPHAVMLRSIYSKQKNKQHYKVMVLFIS